MDQHTPYGTVAHIWSRLGLPQEALQSLHLDNDGDFYPSSFKVDHIAQSTIGLSALAAALFRSTRVPGQIPKVLVPKKHACAEFKSERLYLLNGKPAASAWGTFGGLHKTSDGYIRMHDSFPNHRNNALKILGLNNDATRDDVASKILEWESVRLEFKAIDNGAVIYALRSFEEWDKLPQAKSISDEVITLRRLENHRNSPIPGGKLDSSDKCLRGIRVVDMSRVIAAPVAGKTLAAHGADVIWITSPKLPDLPDIDIDVNRGKRTVQLDIKKPEDKARLLKLLSTADVFIQAYRPGSLAALGLSEEQLSQINPNLILANLSAWGPLGPWSKNRGFDSMVQTVSGLNVEDAKRFGAGEPAHVLPCQALDHGAGYLLATGIIAALYKRTTTGGSYEVNVSLAGVMKYLRSLGQYSQTTAFQRENFTTPEEVREYLETRNTDFGELSAVRHSASIEGVEVGWDIMPKHLGSDQPVWL